MQRHQTSFSGSQISAYPGVNAGEEYWNFHPKEQARQVGRLGQTSLRSVGIGIGRRGQTFLYPGKVYDPGVIRRDRHRLKSGRTGK